MFSRSIRHATVIIQDLSNFKTPSTLIGHAYCYDRLNRLLSMQVFNEFSPSSNTWSAGSNVELLEEALSYDANGNILTYARQGNSFATPEMDCHMTCSNRLDHVDDKVTGSNYAKDIDDQNPNYDQGFQNLTI